MRAAARIIVFSVYAVLTAGCAGPQSALDPAGRGAEQIFTLTLWMFGGGILVWIGVLGLALYAIRTHGMQKHKARVFIIGGGAILPAVILTVLLVYGLSMMPDLIRPAPEGSLRIAVRGEQWWWRVQYLDGDGPGVQLANEIRLPVGEPAEFVLTSGDVVHSFWIPPLGPKMDMIPGRESRLTLHPEKTGIYRGVCAEFCGSSHALMAFDVVVMAKEDFQRWLEDQSEGARAADGLDLFLRTGCGACHSVRGTEADGMVGPDLTHVGGRLTVGAGTLPNTVAGFLRWLTRTDAVKPGVHMPDFAMLPDREQQELARFLDALE